MKKIGFIGAYDKSDLIIHVAKILNSLEFKVLIVDASWLQKMKYIVPSINPTKSYVTSFEDMDFAIGFDSWENVERYFGASYDSNEMLENKIDIKTLYDFVLIDVDTPEMFEKYGIEGAEKNFFVTSFDMYSLKKGLAVFEKVRNPLNVTRVLFSYDPNKNDEEYLNFISLEYRIEWNEYVIYFPINNEDAKVIQENQRFEKIRYKKLSNNYKESLAYLVQDIVSKASNFKIKKIMKDEG